jgi:fatty-acyl-CoA synthase
MPITDVKLATSYWAADTSREIIETTLHGLLREGARSVPDRVALVDGVADPSARRRWTYAELLADAERAARALLARFTPGEAVALYAANSPEWMVLQHGLSLAGLRLVPLNPAYKLEEVEVILRSSQAVGVIHEERYRDNDMAAIVATLRTELEHLREAIPMDELDAFFAEGDPSTQLPEVTPDDLLQIQYTSGTTGVPKGALLHHRGVINTSRFAAERIGFPEGGVWVNAMPMFHIAGAAVTEIGCLAHQGTFVLARGFEPGEYLELMESERCNATLIVPTMIYALLEHPDFARRDLSSMEVIVSGAADVPPALVERVKAELGCNFSILYGQTESNGPVCETRPDDSIEDQTETLGQPLPCLELKIADPVDLEILPIGAPGEICVRGYQTMTGYFNLPDASAATVCADGWLRTGDLGVMDDRGYVRIVGRLKDMIVRGGLNLYPREIEAVILDHPGVAQVSVIGVPDEKWGETVGAVVLPADPDDPPAPQELNEHCRARLSAHKAPLHWYFVSEYPLTPSGKIQKFKLVDWVRDGVITPAPWTLS